MFETQQEKLIEDEGQKMVKQETKPENFLLQLIDVKPQDVNLKFIFDNLRNYGIAATVMVGGFYLFKHGAQINPFPGSGIVFGSFLVSTGFVIFCLNLVQAIWALVKIKVSMLPYLFFSVVLFLGTSELLWVLVKQLLAKA